MIWDSYFNFINSNELIRIIAVISVIFIMFKMNLDPRVMFKGIAVIALAVFGFWIITNIDYIFSYFIR